MKTVNELMTRNVDTVRPEDTLQQAARKMKDHDCGSLPVCNDRTLVGMVTDRDITVRATAEGRTPDTRVADVMTRDVVCCTPEQSLEEAADLMREHQVRRLPVVDANRNVVGLVPLGKLAREEDPKTAGKVIQEVSEPTQRPPER